MSRKPENNKCNDKVKILAFLCNWCSYAGADLAGVSRLQYPPNVMDIRVMCSGTISPYHVLKAFQMGIDGVLIAGCHIGDCHYIKGNYMTYKRFQVIKDILGFIGIEEDRLRLEWVSAAEGEKFAEVIKEFTGQVERVGASPLSSRWDSNPENRDRIREAFKLLESLEPS